MSTPESEYYEAREFWEGDALQDANNLDRIRKTAELIPDDVTSLVDVGCGNGVFVNYLQRARPSLDIFAIDRSRAALAYVKTPKGEGDIASLSLPENSYDCVTCLEVVEHLPNAIYQSALDELARVTKKYIIVSVPFAEHLEQNHTQCPQCRSIFNADLHLRSFSEETILGLLSEQKFDCVQSLKLGEQVAFKGHYRYARAFYPGNFRRWRSPVCPLCGYKAERSDPGSPSAVVVSSPRSRSLISYLSALPKLVWPKERSYYWIMGLYRRRARG